MTHDPVITEALKPCRICNSPCRIEVFGGGVHCDPAEIWMCSAHKMFGGQCQSDITYLTEQAWQAAMHRANPVVDVEGMVGRIMPELEIPLHDYQRGGDSQTFLRQVVRAAIEALNSQGGL